MTEPNGFYYMRARYYDPEVGRFISEDPIGFDGGDVNLMAYVGNNPVSRIDPWGLTQRDIDLMLSLARATQPDLNVPDKVSVGNLGGDTLGFANPITRNITIDDRFLEPLSKSQQVTLFETIVHESIHRTKPSMDSILRPFTHPDIYEDARQRTQGQENTINSCYAPSK